jgi:hypothetical protein
MLPPPKIHVVFATGPHAHKNLTREAAIQESVRRAAAQFVTHVEREKMLNYWLSQLHTPPTFPMITFSILQMIRAEFAKASNTEAPN